MRNVIFGIATAAFVFLGACQDKPTPPSPQIQTYGAYMLVMGKDYQAKDLGVYAATLPPIYEKYGGEYVAFTTDMTVFEGAYGYQSLIVSGWPSVQAAQDFWSSPEYREAIKLREGIGTFDVVVIPSLKKNN